MLRAFSLRVGVVSTIVVLSLAGACTGDSTSGPIDAGSLERTPGIPEGWSGTVGNLAAVGTTTTEKHSGGAAVYLTGPTTAAVSASTSVLTQSIRADTYRGKRVRLSAWVRPIGVSEAVYAGLWMRVDAPGATVSFDNMFSRPVSGSGDWRQISVVLDVPSTAIGIAFGVLYSARNTMLIDDIAFDVVGTDVALTAPVNPQTASIDSSAYQRAQTAPTNLGFEGLPGPATATVDWLSQNAKELTTTDPNASLADLEPLRQMIGSAHLVGLGEGTHGTREFFQMKHRILKFLVTQMGFTHFAIEATSPESDDVNRYVLTGQGDPAKVLSRLYFWTWNTQEVADMIAWMRQWNSTAPANQRVQFLGFDMQAPGASVDSVISYVNAVDQASLADVNTHYQCIQPYRNLGPVGGRPSSQYLALPGLTRAACATALQTVFDLIKNNKAAYVAASSASKYEASLHHARLVQQYEAMISSATGPQSRDASMAENVMWLKEQAGPDAKLVLWAHNGHINALQRLMGGYLRTANGADYRTLGFAFGKGSLTAVGSNGTQTTTLGTWTTTVIPKSSIEAVFEATGKARLVLDTRAIAAGGAAAAPLAGPIRMRSIGAVFAQASESAYFTTAVFPQDFDLLVYLANTSASVRLPFVY